MPSLRADAFVPVLCLVREEALDERAAGVRVCTTATLLSQLTRRPSILSREWLDFLRFELDMSTRSAGDPTPPEPAYSRPHPREATPRRVARPQRPNRPNRAQRRRRKALADLFAAVIGLVLVVGGLTYLSRNEAHPTKTPHPVVTRSTHATKRAAAHGG